MNPESVKLVYFSPTGTTKRIVQEIAKGIQAEYVKDIDYTKPAIRAEKLPTFHDDFVILGTPVYYGRVPLEVADYFTTVTAHNTPAAVIVVYGNREYDDALKEFYDIAVNAGFTPIAGGAFIGEHSFSSESIPIAHGRPDAEDLRKARDFGANIQEKLHRFEETDTHGDLNLPGNKHYQKKIHKQKIMSKIAPVTKKKLCTQCGRCVEACPTGAIYKDNVLKTEIRKCLLCHACVKTCPTGARVMKNSFIKTGAKFLHKTCQQRKEPEIFL